MVFKTPLAWPQGYKRTVDRKDARFAAKGVGAYSGMRSLTIVEATNRLREELARIGVRNFEEDVIVSSNLKINFGGTPRSDQSNPSDPGVAVYWEINGKARNMPIDIYNRAADNIAAVAATLKAMRDIERHGGKVIQDKAFTAFDALPMPDTCWQILRLGKDDRDKESIVHAFKNCAASLHDHRGMPTDMAVLVRARDEALAQIRGEK